MDLRTVFNCMISVSELGRGQASKVIQAVEDQGTPYIVIKNNKPQAVIVSIHEYIELMKAKDMVNSLAVPAPSELHHSLPVDNGFSSSPGYAGQRPSSLTADEINIFLQEEND